MCPGHRTGPSPGAPPHAGPVVSHPVLAWILEAKSKGGRWSGNMGADAPQNEARPDSIASLIPDHHMAR